MTQHEIIPMLIGFGLVILFGLLIYYIRHLQNSHAKKRAFIINDWQNRFLEICQSLEAAKEETKAVKAQLIDQVFLIDEAERWKHKAGQEEIKKIVVIDREKVVSDSLADTKRLLDLELNDREHHEAIIDQQNAMILELKDMVKNLIEKGKAVDQLFIDEVLKAHVETMNRARANNRERCQKILEKAKKNGTYTGKPNYVGFVKSPRPISSLKPNEAIQVNNEAEKDGILKLMDAEGWKWRSGRNANQFYPLKSYPYGFDYNHLGDNRIGFSSICFYKNQNFTILSASDFLPAEQPEPIEPRPDHPCLKGCSKLDACFCPPGAPRDGQVEVWYLRNDLIAMGCNLTQSPKTWHEDKLLLDAWAKEKGLDLLGTRKGGHSFKFTRPAVNSDFDVPNAV